MRRDSMQFIPRGISRDASVSKFNKDLLYDALNIRITAREGSNLLSVTNEKGNNKIELNTPIVGTLIGYNVLNSYTTIFTTDNGTDRIYRINYDGVFTNLVLYEGHLNFSTGNPIETLGIYETEEIQKVYWVDGRNQTRLINIVAPDTVRSLWTDNSFNFVQNIKLDDRITVIRNDVANGKFEAGTIQYAFSYYNLYGQQSNIFYVSPVNYISFSNRGASPEESVSNSFSISMEVLDGSFDYIRIYSIQRTSIDATPIVKIVSDIPLSTQTIAYEIDYIGNGYTFTLNDSEFNLLVYEGPDQVKTLANYVSTLYTDGIYYYEHWDFNPTGEFRILEPSTNRSFSFPSGGPIKIVKTFASGVPTTFVMRSYSNLTYVNTYQLRQAATAFYVDTGTTGTTIDPTELLYIGGEEAVFGTITQKDNTLFLGNYKLSRELIPQNIRDSLKESTFDFRDRETSLPSATGTYPYENKLKYDSYKIKTFKSHEYFRIGVQFQHNTGKWSEAIYIGDFYNDRVPQTVFSTSTEAINYLIRGNLRLGNATIISDLVSLGYVRARGIVVYPSLNDREVICQGVLCPTVYNVADRASNSPFAMSSWFTRPSLQHDINLSVWTDSDNYDSSSKAITTNNATNLNIGSSTILIDNINKGAWAEFRHNKPIPDNLERNAEIQVITNPPSNPYLNGNRLPDNSDPVVNYVSNNKEYFYTDQSILTFHSPDIEFNEEVQNIDTSALKLRIVGLAQFTSTSTDVDIITSTPQEEATQIGFYEEKISTQNLSVFGLKGLVSAPFWYDKLAHYQDNVRDKYTTAFVTYPWHRNGSLNNFAVPTGTEVRSAMLQYKKMSNLRYSYYNRYLFNMWEAKSSDSNHTGITQVSIFNSNEQNLIRIPAPENSGLDTINYYGNVDKVVTVSRVGDRKDGYPIAIAGIDDASKNSHGMFISNYSALTSTFTKDFKGTDPVRIKYKSTPHAVFALNYTLNGRPVVLPTIKDSLYTDIWNINTVEQPPNGQKAFWDHMVRPSLYQDVINVTSPYGFLYLAELYNDDVPNRFGGNTEEAIENNLWLPAGNVVSLIDENGNAKSLVNVEYTEGDAYYQRYDHLKTYPYTLEDQNSMTDIISFMVESRINLDGRYDRNRGQVSNLVTTPSIFNLMNTVYSQKNNFFNYRGANLLKFSLNYFPNSIYWSREKILGEIIDTWTNITLASTLDLDGDKGEITSLNTFNNEIFCFQRSGFSNILFNNREQISVTQGAPIEITNSGKVSGKRYISNKIGCLNKWSIVESSAGLYFMDNLSNAIYCYNGNLDSLNDRLGMRSWFSQNNSTQVWNPVDWGNFRSFNDKTNDDIYFINKDQCLVYSELLQSYTSFMSYEKVPAMFNVEGKFISYKNNDLWDQNMGDYNMFYDEFKPYSITAIANKDERFDKVFDTIEFRSDTWNNNTLTANTFNKLEVWNEYQRGTSTLIDIKGKSSTLKKKFRVWRANIPRDNTNKLDRIRNTWAYVKLSMDMPNMYRTELHDLIVNYLI